MTTAPPVPSELELLAHIHHDGSLARVAVPPGAHRLLYRGMESLGLIRRVAVHSQWRFWDLTAAGVARMNRLFIEPLTLKVA